VTVQRRPHSRLASTSRLSIAAALAVVVGALPRDASAQPCLGDECGPLCTGGGCSSPGDPPAGDYKWDTQPNGTHRTNFHHSSGTKYAEVMIDPAVDGIPIEDLIGDDPVQRAINTPGGLQTFDGSPFIDGAHDLGAAAGSAAVLGFIANAPPSSRVATDTGVQRVVLGNGGTPPGSVLDPVEPIRGELVIEETDLALPSAGIPFRLVRTYRSRTDFRGPFGPVWDHSYNQRLFSVERDDAPLDPNDLPRTRMLVDGDPLLGTAPCAPVVALTTGSATTIVFRELSRIDGVIAYSSAAVHVTLRGHEVDGTVTWTLTSPLGDVRHFDRYGRLVKWVDTNGLGLTLAWTGTDPSELDVVTDAEGRVIDFAYDTEGRLERVSEAASGLEATYAYDDNGALEVPTRSDGRSEQYIYDYDPSRRRGDWIAEGQVRAACDAACSPVNAPACTGGGACEAAVAAATSECLGSCEPCAQECRSACPSQCSQSCWDAIWYPCEQDCEAPDSQDRLKDACRDAYYDLTPKYPPPGGLSAGPPEYCHGCDEACGDAFSSQCATFIGLGYDYDGNTWEYGFSGYCESSGGNCCGWGTGCDPDSCNVGESCYDSCKAGFLGFGDFVSTCPGPGEPTVLDLDATEWAARHGCLPTATRRCTTECIDLAMNGGVYGYDEATGILRMVGCREPCEENCGETCDTECRRYDCDTACDELDLAGQCESSCTSACIDEAHAAGPTPGPEYGHEIDLNFNIIEVRDGAGRVYLKNDYGHDLGSPDFDSITHQDFGGTGDDVGHMARRDLVTEHELMTPRPPPPWSAPYAESRTEFETVQICPFTCPPDLAPPDDLFVPVGDVVMAFLDADEPTLVKGYEVSYTAVQAVQPTVITFSEDGGELVGRIERRGSKLNYLATASIEVPIQIADGVDVVIGIDKGEVEVTGDQAGRDRLLAAGALTLFTDKSLHLRAYAGTPDEILLVSSGTCDVPFQVLPTSADEIELVPEAACGGELWITPLAGAYPVAAHAALYADAGLAALSTSAFHPTTLAGHRDGYVWRRGIEQRLVREPAPTAYGRNKASEATRSMFEDVPMLSAPIVAGTPEPLYVFHQVDADFDNKRPFPPPSDRPWIAADPSDIAVVPCDPDLPEAPRRGSLAESAEPPGPVPVNATVIEELHGAFRTYYADEGGNVIRVVDHATATVPAAVTSFNYDPSGQMIAVEAADGARTCLTYDARGNVTEQLHLPAVVSGLPTPEPIRETFQYRTQDSKPRWIGDPRYPGSPRRQVTYDAAGNPATIIDGAGVEAVTTSFVLAGGSASDPTRFQIGRIVAPGGAQTALEWNAETGTLDGMTVDLAGAALHTDAIHDHAGRLVSSTTPLGLLTQHSFDGPLLVDSTWSAGSHSGIEQRTYDADGMIASITTGPLRIELTYDLRGEVMQIRRVPSDGTAAISVECRDVAPDSLVHETVSGEGVRVRYERDVLGRVVRVLAGDLGPSTGTWDDGCLAHPTAGAAGEQYTLATLTYDVRGRLRQSTDPRGGTTTYVYDGHGRAVIVQQPDGTQLRRGYDAIGAVVWEATYAGGLAPAGYRPPSWTDTGLRAATEIDYDRRDRVKEVRRWHFASGPVGDGVATTRFAYNDATRTVTQTDDAGNAWVTRYDGAGRVLEERAPDGTARTYAYSTSSVRVTEPTPTGEVSRSVTLTPWGAAEAQLVHTGSGEHVISTMTYDDFLRPISTALVTGGSVSVTYDAFGRVLTQSQIAPDSAREDVLFGYDRDGRVLTRLSAADDLPDTTWHWTYDALGRERTATDPEGGVTSTSYVLGSSLPARITDPRGVQNDYTWSAPTAPAQLSLVATDPAGPDVALSYLWDGLGQLVSATRTDQGTTPITNTFTYDSLGAKTRETDSVLGPTLTRFAQSDGRGLRTRTDVGTTYWTQSYDALSRLRDVKVGTETTPLARYAYAGFGFVRTRTLGNGVETGYAYDELGRLVGQTETKLGTPAQTLATWSWATPLDGAPRRATLSRPTATVDPLDTSVYTVDTLGRLLSEDHSTAATFTLAATTTTAAANSTAAGVATGNVWDYLLDGHSSWVERARGTAGVTAYDRDGRDALKHIGTTEVASDAGGAVTDDGELSVTYDALGQVTQLNLAGAKHEYRRDALGRVVSHTGPGNLVTQLAYDGSTRVLRKRPTGVIDINIDGAGLDEHIATVTGHDRQFLHQDRLGSIYLVTSSAGAPAEWTSYTAYGEPTLRGPTGVELTASAVNAQFGFNGLPHDFALGVVDMRARLYRPTIGRFLSPDPLGLVDGSNRFAFAGASPLSFRDPFGLAAKASRDGAVEPFRIHPSVLEYHTQQAQEMAEVEFFLRQQYNAQVRAEEAEAARAELRKTGRLFANALGFTAVVLGGMAGAAAVPVAVVAAPAVVSAGATFHTAAQVASGAVVRKLATSTVAAGLADVTWGLATPEGTPDIIPGGLETVGRLARKAVGALDDAAPVVKTLAIGLNGAREHRAGLLRRFADKIGAITYWDIYGEGVGTFKTVAPRILAEMKARPIAVNLSGLEEIASDSIDDIVAGLRSIYAQKKDMSITQWEIKTILSNDSLLNKTSFYMNGELVSISPWQIFGP
jgi:RHS repeat-associated protein